MGETMKISIADKDSNVEALTRLFASNLTPQYISHSELQGYRALSPGKWAKNIQAVLREEIRSRLKQPRLAFPNARDWNGVIEAYENKRPVGVALVTISRASAVPFGVIEDVVIDKRKRDGGRGAAIMHWISSHMLDAGIKRLFLESGFENERAHHLFESIGFKPVSVVMMRELNK